MTAPPGGPYGQGPYGANPYGQGQPWGGQPQGGPYPYAPPPTGPYPYPPPGGPYAPGGYPPQQYPPGGQPPPPGGGPGPYPPGPPPGGPNSRLPWIIIAGLTVLGVVALVATLVITLSGNDNKSPSATPTTTANAPTSPMKGSAQTATDCTPNVSPGDPPRGDAIIAGKLSFPASAAPGWTVFADDQDPNLIGAVGVLKDVPGANQWQMSAEVAMTNFVTSMDIATQASKLMQCVSAGPGYSSASPSLGPLKTSSTTVDGTKAARVDADITIADPTRGVKGDSVVIIAVDTKPVTIFMGTTPIGDTASAAIVNKVIGALKVAK